MLEKARNSDVTPWEVRVGHIIKAPCQLNHLPRGFSSIYDSFLQIVNILVFVLVSDHVTMATVAW